MIASRAVAVTAALAIASGCVHWRDPETSNRRIPLARPVVELRTDVIPGAGAVLNDGTFRFVVEGARLCRRTELVREESIVVEQKDFTGLGLAALYGGAGLILVGGVVAATDDSPGNGAGLIAVGLLSAGLTLYHRYAKPPTRRERVAEQREIPSASVEVACEDTSVARVLGELVLTTPWGANLKATPGSDGAAVFNLDWSATGIDMRSTNPGVQLMTGWRLRSTRTGVTVDWTPTVADRDTAISLIERSNANRPTEPPELAVVALGADGGALIAGEETTMRITVENRGGGVARALSAKIRSSHPAADGAVIEFGDLAPRETKTRTFPVRLRADEPETQVTVVARFSLAAFTPPADSSVRIAITPRLCPPEKLTRAQYTAKRDRLRAMVKSGVLTDADLQRYDAILVGCLR